MEDTAPLGEFSLPAPSLSPGLGTCEAGLVPAVLRCLKAQRPKRAARSWGQRAEGTAPARLHRPQCARARWPRLRAVGAGRCTQAQFRGRAHFEPGQFFSVGSCRCGARCRSAGQAGSTATLCRSGSVAGLAPSRGGGRALLRRWGAAPKFASRRDVRRTWPKWGRGRSVRHALRWPGGNMPKKKPGPIQLNPAPDGSAVNGTSSAEWVEPGGGGVLAEGPGAAAPPGARTGGAEGLRRRSFPAAPPPGAAQPGSSSVPVTAGRAVPCPLGLSCRGAPRRAAGGVGAESSAGRVREVSGRGELRACVRNGVYYVLRLYNYTTRAKFYASNSVFHRCVQEKWYQESQICRESMGFFFLPWL